MRNTNSHFSYAPTVDVSRSSFDRPSTHKTTFDKAGLLYPIFLDEVLPGDTHSLKTSLVIRTATPIFPVMDNMFLDIYYFFIPNRLVWTHWKEFMGENTQSAWVSPTTYTIPKIMLKGLSSDSVLDHFGIRPNNSTSTTSIKVSALPIRAYCLVWNEWFRKEAIMDPIAINTGDTDITSAKIPTTITPTTYLTNTAYGGVCAPVSKFGDYFTSSLPAPQKGSSVLLPLGQSAPIFFSDNGTNDSTHVEPTKFTNMSGSVVSGTITSAASTGYATINSSIARISNGYADLSNATSATINDLRLALNVQRLLEVDARSGSRYVEVILAHFGVRSPDSRLQRPEYLGGKRIRINMQQVLQTSSTDSTSPQGNVAAFSLTADSSGSFSQSFTEHGFILGVACIRTSQTYQYGIERHWFRNERLDYYFPVLANLGEQEVYQREIYYNGTTAADAVATNYAIFGYQEAWAEYRYKNSLISGAFRSNSSSGASSDGWQSLDTWHYAEKLTAAPTLGPAFIEQSNEPVARTLAVQGEEQFIADFYFDMKSTRPMPTYSIPGLESHF